MKKIIYTLILVFLFGISFPLLTACDKKEAYNLNNFKTDFYAIATSCEVVEKNGDYLLVDYNSQQMRDLISTNENYKNLAKYQTVLNNSLNFVYSYIELISNNNLNTSNELKNELETSLNAFKGSFDDLKLDVEALVDLTQVNGADAGTNISCIHRVGFVASSYLKTIQSAIALSEVCEEIYYTSVISNANVDIRNISLADFNPSAVTLVLPARIHSQIVDLTKNFVKTQIELTNLASGIKDGTQSLDLTQDNYINNVNLINKTFVESVAESKANANKTEFYNLALTACNYQFSFENDKTKTQNAYNNYGVQNITNPTYIDTLNKSIIDNNLIVLKNYNSVLVNMLNIILGV